MFRRLSRVQLVADIGVAVGFGALMVPLHYYDGVFGVIVLLAMTVGLAMRRLSPGLALLICWLGVIVQLLAAMPATLANGAILAVLFSSGAYGERHAKWFGLASSIVGGIVAGYYTAYLVMRGSGNGIGGDLPSMLIFGTIAAVAAVFVLALSWTVGLLIRTGRAARAEGQQRYLAEREQYAAQQAMFALEERNRIARDMHDVVAHSLAVIIAQSDGSRYVNRGKPEALDQTLQTVSETAREALTDVRLLLSELRHSQGDGPQPMLADLGHLIDQMRSTGLDVRFTETGQMRTIPTGQQIALYRIVQESLTNALRHGDQSRPVHLHFQWTTPQLTVQIANSTLPLPPGQPPRAPGHGLPGMQERAALAGGSLRFTRPAGLGTPDFVVTATLPIPHTGSIATARR